MKRCILWIGVVVCVWVASGSVAWADGMIVPVHDEIRVRGSWAVKYHKVDMIVRDQVAAVTIDQEFVNTGNRTMEVEYMFPVPPGAAIDAMTLMVNGKEFQARLLPADEARKIYEDIVRRKKDPALLEYVGYGLYRTRAFPLEPGKPAKVLIHYNHLCKRSQDVVEVFYPLNTEKFSAKAIEEVRVRVDVKTSADITTVHSPTHKITVDRKEPRHVVATYSVKGAIPNTDFVLYYKAKDEKVGATLMTYQPDPLKDGYFMLLASPNPRAAKTVIQPKDLVLVIDRSGSMSGDNKIQQARESLKFILGNLNPEDRFSLVSYNDGVDVHFTELAAASAENVAKAKDVAERMEAMGGTNIHEALAQSMKLLAGDRKGRPGYVIFVTDGLPTMGNTNAGEIVDHTTKANTTKARIVALGVGYDVNVKLLDRLAEANQGFTDYVKPNEALEVKISALYTKIKNPLMTDLKITVPGVTLRDHYPRTFGDLFDGMQLTVVGRFDAKDVEKLTGRKATLLVTGNYQGKERGFEYPVTFKAPGKNSLDGYIERLWAVRRVGFLLDEIQLRGESKELSDEIIRLSRTYGIMTPYTAFLADETTDLAKTGDARKRGRVYLGQLAARESGGEAQRDAATRRAMKNAAHAPDTGAAPADSSSGGRTQTTTKGYGYSTVDAYEKDRKETIETVRTVGNITLYRRGDLWLTPEMAKLDLEKDKELITIIKRFSEEYFKLLEKTDASQKQVMASQAKDERLMFKLEDSAILIE
jgi:Ca-activated chloride channel homolog